MSPTRFASEHRWLYIGAIVLLVALAVIGLIRYERVRTTNEAHNKANELSGELIAAGFPAPNTDNLVRALGDDGGLACSDPTSALRSALWKINMSNGAAGPGIRPVIADKRVVEAGALVLKVYCPDKLHDLQDKIDDLKTDTTVRQ
ncbi:hypothetical protein [Streptomyces mangrovisoli]|uniref:Uncharacterized protein n=1 Tax=Streptomyces mangrovisoli TaxID=1428628 RepID=A0A1J4NRM4_9ACTN|nr:hypothetical protein [Streptomyces mangrovisoli]OIJ64244.1 hypothetical protein WN71_029180 [Streptomyces mangrovisoli]